MGDAGAMGWGHDEGKLRPPRKRPIQISSSQKLPALPLKTANANVVSEFFHLRQQSEFS
jgi:hypothetical protein